MASAYKGFILLVVVFYGGCDSGFIKMWREHFNKIKYIASNITVAVDADTCCTGFE